MHVLELLRVQHLMVYVRAGASNTVVWPGLAAASRMANHYLVSANSITSCLQRISVINRAWYLLLHKVGHLLVYHRTLDINLVERASHQHLTKQKGPFVETTSLPTLFFEPQRPCQIASSSHSDVFTSHYLWMGRSGSNGISHGNTASPEAARS